MRRAGMNGSPVTGPQMAWLLHRSSYLGFPAPARRLAVEVDEWGTGDLADLLGEVGRDADPFGTTLRVTGILDGRAVTRHVVVLTVGRMQQMDIPQADQPWMTLADSLGIPLEWSAHVTPRADKDVLAEIRLILGKISSQTNHYEVEHDHGPSLRVGGAAGAGAAGRGGTVRPGGCLAGPRQGMVADRGIGPDGIRVPGSLRAGRHRVPRQVDINHTFGQHDLAREFLPASGSVQAHSRELPVRAVAAGGPAVTSMAGDRRGWNIGRSSLDNPGDVRPVAQHGGLRRRRSVPDHLRARRRQDQPDGHVRRQDRRRRHRLVRHRSGRPARPAGPHRAAARRVGEHGSGQRRPRVAEPVRAGAEPQLADFAALDLADMDDTEVAAVGLRIEDLHAAKLSDLDPDRVDELRRRGYRQARTRASATAPGCAWTRCRRCCPRRSP